jgi:hypothetical protein
MLKHCIGQQRISEGQERNQGPLRCPDECLRELPAQKGPKKSLADTWVDMMKVKSDGYPEGWHWQNQTEERTPKNCTQFPLMYSVGLWSALHCWANTIWENGQLSHRLGRVPVPTSKSVSSHAPQEITNSVVGNEQPLIEHCLVLPNKAYKQYPKDQTASYNKAQYL